MFKKTYQIGNQAVTFTAEKPNRDETDHTWSSRPTYADERERRELITAFKQARADFIRDIERQLAADGKHHPAFFPDNS